MGEEIQERLQTSASPATELPSEAQVPRRFTTIWHRCCQFSWGLVPDGAATGAHYLVPAIGQGNSGAQ